MSDTAIDKIKHGNLVMQPKYLAKYSERALPQRVWALSLMRKHNFQSMSRILDLGCRDGFVAMELAKANPGAHVKGVDNSIQLLEQANENLARNPLQNLEFSLLDALPLYPPETLDAVFSASYLHWVQDKQALLKWIKQVLKPGGQAFLSFFADHQKKRFDTCITETANAERWGEYFKNYRRAIKEIKAYQFGVHVYKAGLVLERLEFVEVHDVFESKLQFMDWLTTWCDHLKYLPEDMHYVFLSEVADKHLEAYPPDSKGQIHRFDYMLEADIIKETNV